MTVRALSTTSPPLGRVGVFSPGIWRIPHLTTLLGAERLVFRPGPLRPVDGVVGWGRKPNTAAARRYAAREGVPYLSLEDGFLRSVGLGVAGEPPLSIVVDDLGVHYDATGPSRLERTLASSGDDDPLADPALLERARSCIARIREARVSKYNDAPVRSLGPSDRERVLVVDQTAGDLSVELGGVDAGGFDAMLRAALDEHPDAEVIVKTHPDVARGAKRGCLAALRPSERVRVLAEPSNPIALLEQVDRVYVATSLLGLEALMLGLPVTCFGVPFYAGWGLTDDRADVPARRGRRRSVEQVFAAAYLGYARYVAPDDGARCEAELVLEHLARQREVGEANTGTSIAVGFSLWKRGFVQSFLDGPGAKVRFASGVEEAERALEAARASGGGADLSGALRIRHRRARPCDADPARLVVWGTRERPELRALAARYEVPLWRMEDGFLRSVGLGSDLHAPLSLVVDREGIYYDPSRPSELERILEEALFTTDELARARALREGIVREELSKYNAARGSFRPRAEGRPVVLVIGQVEDDASIQLGCVDVRRNEELLRAARAARPDAFLVYKPHPDVVSGNRACSLPASRARELCDQVVIDAKVADCLRAADEVHTMTSLVGFEALLRGLPVSVHGQPFYAGWGLTRDRHPHPRRTRALTLDQLVAGVLLRYPRYVSPLSRRFTTPEATVAQLVRERERWRPRRWPARQLAKLVLLAREAWRAP